MINHEIKDIQPIIGGITRKNILERMWQIAFMLFCFLVFLPGIFCSKITNANNQIIENLGYSELWKIQVSIREAVDKCLVDKECLQNVISKEFWKMSPEWNLNADTVLFIEELKFYDMFTRDKFVFDSGDKKQYSRFLKKHYHLIDEIFSFYSKEKVIYKQTE